MVRFTALDGLRGLAIVQVLIVHFTHDRWQVALAMGVDIFFVLSGFLITRLVLSSMGSPTDGGLRPFLRRRFTRIYPPLVALCAVYVIAAPAALGVSVRSASMEAVAALTFTFPVLLAMREDFTAGMLPLWSLSVEGWFYAIWPTFLWKVVKKPTRSRLTKVLVVVVLSSLVVQVVRAITYVDAVVVLHRIRVDLLGIGAAWALFGYLRDWKMTRASSVMAALGLPLVLVSSVLSRPFPYDVEAGIGLLPEPVARFFGPWGGPGFTIAMWCLGAFLMSVFAGRHSIAASVLSAKPIVWLGVISYSVYLWHYPLGTLIYRWAPDYIQWDEPSANIVGGAIYFVLSAAVSILIGWLSYRFIERNCARLLSIDTWKRLTWSTKP